MYILYFHDFYRLSSRIIPRQSIPGHLSIFLIYTLTAEEFSETSPFMYLSNHVFRSQYFQKYLSYEAHFFKIFKT